MPKASQQRRPSLDLAGRQASSPGTNGSTSLPLKGTERQPAQSLTPADAELILTVLREVRRGNFSVRMPMGPVARSSVARLPRVSAGLGSAFVDSPATGATIEAGAHLPVRSGPE